MIRLGHANHPQRDVLAEIDWAAAHGFDFVDLYLEPGPADYDQVDPTAVRERLEQHGFPRVTGHIAASLTIGSEFARPRLMAVATATQYLRVFARIGIPAVTVHTDWPPEPYSVEQGLAWQVETLGEILSVAEGLGLRLMLEACGHPAETIPTLQRIFAALPRLLCHLDLGHAHLNGGQPDQALRVFADRLHHVHLHDNDGTCDQHLPPGEGTIDWPAVVRALREIAYDRTITIEVFSPDRERIATARAQVAGWLRPG